VTFVDFGGFADFFATTDFAALTGCFGVALVFTFATRET
jgi:hypothetical protein